MPIDQTLLIVDSCTNTNTTISVTEIPGKFMKELFHHLADSLDSAAKQLSILHENTANSSTTEYNEEENATISNTHNVEDQLTQQKRHIMISYNRSSVKTCRKIYDRLVERNYKVWMDLEHMFDDILVGMARAVENSYIILLCIDQQYYESNHCRLEAEYAAEKRIKFIPCLMEGNFNPQRWLRIVKGSNVHINFSSINNFDASFEELIRQITFIENKLVLYPHRTSNPMMFASMSTPPDTLVNPLNELEPRFIVKLSQGLSNEISQSFSDNEELLKQFVSQTFQQNELLLKLVDRVITQQSIRGNRKHNIDLDRIIKVVLNIIVCQKIIFG